MQCQVQLVRAFYWITIALIYTIPYTIINGGRIWERMNKTTFYIFHFFFAFFFFFQNVKFCEFFKHNAPPIYKNKLYSIFLFCQGKNKSTRFERCKAISVQP